MNIVLSLRRTTNAEMYSIGAVYIAGKVTMSTWIPFLWGWINVLILIVSSFTIQGGL